MSADEVAHEVLRDTRSPKWVRRNVPGKITLGHSTVRWFEDDVWRWLRERRDGI